MLKLMAYCFPFLNILINLPCYELSSLDSLIWAPLQFLMLCRWTGRQSYLSCTVWPDPKFRLKWIPSSLAFWACPDSVIYRTSLFMLRRLAAAQTDQLSLRKTHDFFFFSPIHQHFFFFKKFHRSFYLIGFGARLWPGGMVQYIWKSPDKCVRAFKNVSRPHTHTHIGLGST